jgi:GNAT superfamily N-acetyltransferase
MSVTVRMAGQDDMTEVRRLCWAYRDVLVERSSTRPDLVDHYYAVPDYEALMGRLDQVHARPDGAIFVAELNGEIIGCGMTHRIDAKTCEIKRLYVDPKARGHGAAKELIAHSKTQAVTDGYTRMVLDSMIWLPEAIQLYDRLGFTPCPPYYEPDPDLLDLLIFREIAL